MNEFRREALDESDRPADLSPELAFLAERQAAAGALLKRDRELYPTLFAQYRAEGTSPELSRFALQLAGDVGAVLQSLRSRPDLLQVLEEQPEVPAPPLIVFDQLQFSYLLLTDGASEEQREALLTPEALEELLASKRVVDWTRYVSP